MDDLKKMHGIDIKSVVAINNKKVGPLDSFTQNLAATKVQSFFRGKKGRMDFALLKFT